MTDDTRLAEIRARVPSDSWMLNDDISRGDAKKLGAFVYKKYWGAVAVCPKESPQYCVHHSNMKFIASAPDDARYLLDQIAAKDAEIERLQEVEKWYKSRDATEGRSHD